MTKNDDLVVLSILDLSTVQGGAAAACVSCTNPRNEATLGSPLSPGLGRGSFIGGKPMKSDLDDVSPGPFIPRKMLPFDGRESIRK